MLLHPTLKTDVNRVTNLGETALMKAVRNNHKEIAMYLLERQPVDLGVVTADHQDTVLTYAKDEDLLRTIIMRRGCDLSKIHTAVSDVLR